MLRGFWVLIFAGSLLISISSEESSQLMEKIHRLKAEANEHFEKYSNKDAEAKYEELLKINEELNDKPAIADCLHKLASLNQRMSKYDKAIALLEKTAQVRAEMGDQRGVGVALTEMAGIEMHRTWFNNGRARAERALKVYEPLLPMYRELGDKPALAECLCNLGLLNSVIAQATYDKIRYDKAVGYLENAITLYAELGDRRQMGMVLLAMAGVEMAGDRPSRATGILERALKIFEDMDDKKNIADTLREIGRTYWYTGQYDKALEYGERSGRIAEEIGYKWGVAFNLHIIAALHWGMGDYLQALACSEKSLKMAEEMEDRWLAAIDFNSIAIAHRRLGNYREAMAYYEQALRVREEIGDLGGAAASLNGIGLVHSNLGHYAQALEHYQKALKTRGELRDKAGMSVSLISIGEVYSSLGDHRQALECYQESKRLAEEVEYKISVSESLNNIGTVHSNLGHYQEALEYYRKALNLATEIGDKRGMSAGLDHIGTVYRNLGRYARALKYYRESLRIATEMGDKSELAEGFSNKGLVHYKRKEMPEAEQSLSEAVRMAREIGKPEVLWSSLYRKGLVLRETGRIDEAVNGLKEAVEVIEAVRGQIQLAEAKASFLQERLEVYETLINWLVQLQDFQGAFDYAERAKARAFLDLLTEAKAEIRNRISPELREKEQAVLAKITYLQKSLWEQSSKKGTEEKIKNLESELARAYQDHDRLKLEIGRRSPEYAAIVYPKPVKFDAAQKLLEEKTALLEYVLGEQASHLLVLTKEDFGIYPLKKREYIERKVKNFSRILGQPPSADSSFAYVNAGHELYKLLIQPAEDRLQGKHALIIVPDGNLALLPFAALLTGPAKDRKANQFKQLPYLVKKYEISFVQSASVLERLKKTPRREAGNQKDLIVFADPVYEEEKRSEIARLEIGRRSEDSNSIHARLRSIYRSDVRLGRLKESGVEAERLAGIYGERATIYVREKATEEKVKGEPLDRYRYVHFATHGVFNPNRPAFSALVLGNEGHDDGFLQWPEVLNLDLDAELVVLSACESGLGKQLRGEGLIGLARAFMYAGARSVLASLWRIEDSPATANFMYGLYTALANKDKATALRATQLAFINGSKYSHPFYWAAFVLIGER